MRAPRFKLCHYCGRNTHKVAVRQVDGTVIGCCPACWAGKPGVGFAIAARFRPEQVVYDHRTRRPDHFLGVRDGVPFFATEAEWADAG